MYFTTTKSHNQANYLTDNKLRYILTVRKYKVGVNLKILSVLILTVLLTFTVTGCGEIGTTGTKEPVKINMPTDDTVNGYKTKAESSKVDYGTVNADKVTVESKKSAVSDNISSTNADQTSKGENNTKVQYIGSLNGKIFHKTTCGSAKNIKEEYRFITSNRDDFLNLGYSPCQKCEP